MPKGLCATLAVTALLAASYNLQAQVYRCETPSGVAFSDMPCGDGAQEIAVKGVVMDTMGVGEPGIAQPRAERGAPADEVVSDSQTLTGFLAMLKSQRKQQMGQIDAQLAALRRRVEGGDTSTAENTNRDELLHQIAALESNRDSILAEYEAMIAEAEARLE